MAYKFNPLSSIGLDDVGQPVSALNVVGTVANAAALPGSATTGDVYQAEDTGVFYVWDGSAWDNLGTLVGPQGPTGDTGPTGPDGADGVGIPVGGTDGQALVKASNTDYDTEWADVTAVAALDDLTDVTLTSPSDGQVLEYDSATSTWVNATPSGGGGTPGGSNTQVQFNDGGSFGADSGLTFNKTTNALTVGASTVDGGSAKIYGDINLDDGGSFSTTVQAVTPTANRTISFPDATGTVALVSGANGTIQYNDAGTLKGNSDFTVDPDWNDASTVFTGLKLNVTDGAGGSPVGNSDSNLLDVQRGGTSVLRARTNGSILFLAGGYLYASNSVVARFINTDWQTNRLALPASGLSDTFLERDDAGILAQRNGTDSQTFRLYNTYTDASNFERTSLTRDSSGLVIDAQKGGTGADPTNLLDLKLNGTSEIYYKNAGNLAGFRFGNENISIARHASINYIEYRTISAQYGHVFTVSGQFCFGTRRFNDIPSAVVGSNGYIGWGDNNGNNAQQLYLWSDASNVFAQRNDTNAQTFRLYNTYTDASNYERGFFQWNSNVLEIGSEGLGTGSEQPVRITAATLKLPNLPTYADNTAATSGGLVAGDVYKTATGELRITV